MNEEKRRMCHIVTTILAFIGAILWSLSKPTLHTACIQSMTQSDAEMYNRIEILLSNSCMLFVCCLWEKLKLKRLIEKFPIVIGIRFLFLIALTIFGVATGDVRSYYIIDIYSYAFLATLMNRCCTSIKNTVFQGEGREKYDILTKCAGCAASIIICTLSLIPNLIKISIKTSMILSMMWILVDRGTWLICWIIERKEGEEIDD